MSAAPVTGGRTPLGQPSTWRYSGPCTGCPAAMTPWRDIDAALATVNADTTADLLTLRSTPGSDVGSLAVFPSTGSTLADPLSAYRDTCLGGVEPDFDGDGLADIAIGTPNATVTGVTTLSPPPATVSQPAYQRKHAGNRALSPLSPRCRRPGDTPLDVPHTGAALQCRTAVL